MTQARLVLVMGITASGKSLLAGALAASLNWAAVEADDFHSTKARAKMAVGIGLDDADRLPWLDRVASACAVHTTWNEPVILACSALKRRYRRLLRPDATIFLPVDQATASARAASRTGHFAGPSLIASQLETLEPPDVDEGPLLVLLQDQPPDRQLEAARSFVTALS